jgi:hypothetical protein
MGRSHHDPRVDGSFSMAYRQQPLVLAAVRLGAGWNSLHRGEIPPSAAHAHALLLLTLLLQTYLQTCLLACCAFAVGLGRSLERNCQS